MATARVQPRLKPAQISKILLRNIEAPVNEYAALIVGIIVQAILDAINHDGDAMMWLSSPEFRYYCDLIMLNPDLVPYVLDRSAVKGRS